MKNLICFITLILFFCNAATARGEQDKHYSTRIQINAGNIIHLGDTTYFKTVLRNIGFRVSYKPISWLSVNFSYNKMVDMDVWFNGSREDKNGWIRKLPEPYPSTVNVLEEGFLISRFNYETFDLHLNYSKARKNHELIFGVGACYTIGIDKVTPRDVVFTSAYNRPETKDVPNSFWGPMIDVGYNRFLFNRRLNYGISMINRAYLSAFWLQYFIELNLGYNFDLK